MMINQKPFLLLSDSTMVFLNKFCTLRTQSEPNYIYTHFTRFATKVYIEPFLPSTKEIYLLLIQLIHRLHLAACQKVQEGIPAPVYSNGQQKFISYEVSYLKTILSKETEEKTLWERDKNDKSFGSNEGFSNFSLANRVER